MSKSDLRRNILQKRLAIDENFIRGASGKICATFEKMFGGFNLYLFYLPIKGEVDTASMAEKFHKSGRSVYLPCVDGDSLVFKRFEGLSYVKPGAFGVCEAVGQILTSSADVVVVPAVAFDEKCNRLGYGKGFYDRFLPSAGKAVRVGFAYDFQVIDDVYADECDEQVDFIITEKRVVERSHIIDTDKKLLRP